ncbi:MAG: transporter substrate-binding domain-containing protein [Anaerolineales bacterium]
MITCRVAVVILAFVGVLAACVPVSSFTAEAQDRLESILERGKLVVWVDPNYPPSTILDETQPRPAGTRCTPAEYTASQFSGFDADIAKEVARRLGVEACFVTPSWMEMITGGWEERWDIVFGSLAITYPRMEALYFTHPYLTEPAVFYVHKDNAAFQTVEDLSGRRIGTCAQCTYESYLNQTLQLPGSEIEFRVQSPQMVVYYTEIWALQDLAKGDGVILDAVLTGQQIGEEAIRNGMPLRRLDEPVFYSYIAAAVDRKGKQNAELMVHRISEIILDLNREGLLRKLSTQYYGVDLSGLVENFDFESLHQFDRESNP